MQRRPLAAWAVAALASLASACGPPKEPLEVGVRDVPTDVVIGRREVGGAPGASTTTTSTIMGAPGGVQPVAPTPTTGATPVTAPGAPPPGPSPTTTTSAPAPAAVPLAPDPAP